MRRPAVLAAAGAGALALVAVGGYAYYFSGLRAAPRPLALATASTATGTAAPAAAGAGTWKIASGSLARYRVNEVFAGTTSSHQAVAQTSDVTGSLRLAGGSLNSLQVTAQLTGLQSVDTVAGLNVSQRDRIVQRTLDTAQYPAATFTASGVHLPAGALSGSAGPFDVPGQLTIHGVTRDVVVAVRQLQVSGSRAQVVGQATFAMTDFGVQPPALPITSVQPAVTLEFQLNLAAG